MSSRGSNRIVRLENQGGNGASRGQPKAGSSLDARFTALRANRQSVKTQAPSNNGNTARSSAANVRTIRQQTSSLRSTQLDARRNNNNAGGNRNDRNPAGALRIRGRGRGGRGRLNVNSSGLRSEQNNNRREGGGRGGPRGRGGRGGRGRGGRGGRGGQARPQNTPASQDQLDMEIDQYHREGLSVDDLDKEIEAYQQTTSTSNAGAAPAQ